MPRRQNLVAQLSVLLGIIILGTVAISLSVSDMIDSWQIPALVPLSAVITSPGTNVTLAARPAAFGPMIPRKATDDGEMGGFTGSIHVVKSMACSSTTDREDLREKIALVLRGECGFYEKILVLQEWGAAAVIVGDNSNHRGLITMFTRGEKEENGLDDICCLTLFCIKISWSNIDENDMAEIPSVFVSKESYNVLINIDIVTITSGPLSSPLADTFLFLILSPLCSLTLIYGLLICHRRYRKMRERAPKSFVASLPTRTWVRPNPDESIDPHRQEKVWVSAGECIICLEDYVHGMSKVMRLPCGHEFHSDCISRWLVSRKKTCPICKQDVTKFNENTPLIKRPSPLLRHQSDFDVEADVSDAINVVAASLPVTTPLIEPITTNSSSTNAHRCTSCGATLMTPHSPSLTGTRTDESIEGSNMDDHDHNSEHNHEHSGSGNHQYGQNVPVEIRTDLKTSNSHSNYDEDLYESTS